jgi:hypothetical protein
MISGCKIPSFDIFFFSMAFLVFTAVNSQTQQQREEITKNYDVEKLRKLSKSFSQKYNQNKAEAIQVARSKGLDITYFDEDEIFYELQGISEDGILYYYKTNNVDAAVSTRTDYLNSGGGLGLSLDGQGMTGYVWDGGHVRTTHQEFDGAGGTDRVSLGDVIPEGGINEINHATHVTGTINAAGIQPAAKGMASHADVVSYIWNDDVAEALTAASTGMLVSNHSYSLDPVGLPDYFFGGYTYNAYEWDLVSYNAPFYLMVVSAGNLGTSSFNTSPLDSNFPQYDKLTGQGVSKNNLSVANAEDANIDVNGNLVSVNINSGSSQGPTDDLRVKPDITGNGTGLYSPIATSDNAYATYNGTSMSAPNVAGSLILLQQYHHNLFSTYMRAATLKGLALHTADDAGITGPDANFGWGLLNAKKAAETLSDKGTSTIVEEIVLNQGETYSVTVESDNVNDLLASISWTDPAGNWTSNLNDSTPVLVNDLDIEITQNTSTYYPWRLTGVNTNSNDADNIVDNFERVDVSGPSGSYTIKVTHKGTLTNDVQQFSLIVTGITNVNSFCSAPQDVNVSDIGTTTAEVDWNPSVSSPSDGYDIYYNTTGVLPNGSTTPTTSVLAGVTDLSLSSLSSGTEYFLYVRADCGSGNTSEWSDLTTFSTLCNATAFPYAENFNSGASIPACWTQSRILQSEVASNCGINDTNYLRIYGGFHAVESPPVDVSSESVVEINFDIRNGCLEPSEATENLEIFYWNGSVWTLLDTLNPADLSQFWVHKSYSLSAGLNTLFRLKFQRKGGSLDFDDISIDNLEVKAPTLAPANDNVCNAILLSVNTLNNSGDAFTLKAATAESGEPADNLANGVDGSVWFSFDAPSSGDVRITTDLIGAKSDDAEIAVYTATDCSDFTTFTQIGFDQDDGRNVNIGQMPVIDLQGLNSGETYYVQVDRRPDSSSSTFGIEVSSLDFTYDNINGFLPVNPDGKDLSATEGDLVGGTLNISNGTAVLANETGFKSVTVNPIAVLDLDADLTSDLTFMSDANGSGQLADANGVRINGTTTVERYIPASNRAFRFLSSPVMTSGTIRENWQQGGLTPSDNGYESNVGTHITGDVNGNNGFDATPSGNPSMFIFDNTLTGNQDSAWSVIPNTDVEGLEYSKPYLIFIRGDRSVDLNSVNPIVTPTTLHATGELYIGTDNTQILSQENDFFSLVANPYQAIVDFDQVTKTNLKSDIIVFDPGFGTHGQYVTLTSNRFIKPGQSFFVQNDDDISSPSGGATIEFQESDKNTSGSNPTEVFNDNNIQSLNLNLYNQDNIRMDVMKFRFQPEGNNTYGNDDMGKMFSSTENICSVNSDRLLSVERRDIPKINEVIPLNIFQYQGSNYHFEVDLINWNPNIEIFIFDKYLNEKSFITENQSYNFQVDFSIPQSSAHDRFDIILNNLTLNSDEMSFSNTLSIYPNPSNSGMFNLHFSDFILNAPLITLYNAIGQSVLTQKFQNISGQEFEVNVQSLPSGVYLVKLTNAKQNFYGKLIIE